VGQDCMTISEWAGVEADLVDPAPMAERPHSYTCDPPPGVQRTSTTKGPHSVKAYDARPVHRRYEFINVWRPILSPHGASEDSTAPADELPRESIELRTIAFRSA
jgi:hypothetical protein